MHKKYPHLFQPLKVGNVVLKNRIMTPPMSPQNHPSDHFIGPYTTGFYELRAKGGFANITVGDVIVDTVHGKAHSFQVHGDDPGVEITDAEGNNLVLPADTVLVTAGLKSLEDESLAIVDACNRSWRVGDCVRPGLVRNAVQGGHYAAMDI